MMPRETLLIDCDPGIDDAIMLLMALSSPDLDVRAITTVAGNVPLSLTSRNARIIRELLGRNDIPVFAGCPRPLLRQPVTAEDFHGGTGIDGIEIFEPEARLEPEHGVAAIIRELRSAPPRSMILIVTGPMTNIACALVMAPDIRAHIRQIVVMGGADSAGGNITPHAEFNIFADPHAASIVFSAGIEVSVLSLDVTHQLRAGADRVLAIAGLPGRTAALAASLLRSANLLETRARAGQEAPMHDPSTIAFILRPEIFSFRTVNVTVTTSPGRFFGQTRIRHSAGGMHRWVTQVDEEAFFELMGTLLGAAS